MRETAVDYLIKQLDNIVELPTSEFMNINKAILEAKQKEKEIITEAYSQGRIDEETRFPYATDGEDYYKTEFTNENQS